MGWQELAASLLTVAVLLGTPVQSVRVPSRNCKQSTNQSLNIYDYEVPDVLETRNISLSSYRGRPLLIVNVATYCGFTWHYHQLNALKSTYNNSGFDILGFPCNQFQKQEPGGNGEEIMNGITYVRPGKGFKPNFQIFKKIEVNGENEHPLYVFLKSLCPPTRDDYAPKAKLFYDPLKVRDIRWNFEKFLVNAEGVPVKRYDPSTPPNDIARDVAALISDSSPKRDSSSDSTAFT